MIIPANLNDNKCTLESKDELPLNLVTADDVQIPCADPRGVLPRRHATDVKITAELCYSRPLPNPVVRSPGRFAKKRESALMLLSLRNIFATIFICNNFFSGHIDQVLQEYGNLKTELTSIYEDKGKQAMFRASVAGWRMEND